jgi:nuclear pore complex protein Nup205
MRYLRTRENFFARHLATIPSRMPEASYEPYIEVMYSDASRITTTVPMLNSFLRLRSHIFDLVALDLHVLTNKAHHKGAIELLEILFGNAAEQYNEFDDSLHPFQDVGQPYIIEFVQSLSFDWSDSLTVRPLDLEFLNQLNLTSCIRSDNVGCEIIDRTALLSLLTAAKRVLHVQSRVITAAHVEQLNSETTYVLESCAVENHRREVRHAIANSYQAWRRLLDTVLTKCFTLLPHSNGENMLFDLLHVLPSTLRSPGIQDSTSILLSEAILSAITTLRED